jgi:rubredoxin
VPEANPTTQFPAYSLRLSCPKCSSQMALTRSEPGKPGFDNLTFECPKCGHTDSRAFKMP